MQIAHEIATLLLLFSLQNLHAQLLPQSPRAAGMGGASLSLQDGFSPQHNPAGLANIDSTIISFSAHNKFLLNEANSFNATLLLPLTGNHFSLHVSHFGFSLYNRLTSALGYSRKLGSDVDGGIQLICLRTSMGETYGKSWTWYWALGMLIRFKPELQLAWKISSPSNRPIQKRTKEVIPAELQLGLYYQFNEKIFIVSDWQFTGNHKPVIKLGIEYRPVSSFSLRTGFRSPPFEASYGFTFHLKTLDLIFATSHHQILGWSPTTGLSYAL